MTTTNQDSASPREIERWHTDKPEDSNGYVYVRDAYGNEICTCYSPDADEEAARIAKVPEMAAEIVWLRELNGELLAAFRQLIWRASGLDQSPTHEGLENCRALAMARAVVERAEQNSTTEPARDIPPAGFVQEEAQ